MPGPEQNNWTAGSAPVAVVMISLNEEHNMKAVLDNLKGWAQEVFLVDSFSQDGTVGIALWNGVHVVQRPFRGFGDQWNFAVNSLPISAPWTMKLDPDERLNDELKHNITVALRAADNDGLIVRRAWWFMGKPLPIHDKVLRLWRTNTCRFSSVSVNEHPQVDGTLSMVQGELEHHDSPDLHHWFEKQNRYSTAEAINAVTGSTMALTPKLFGSNLQRRMWLKKWLQQMPFAPLLMFFYFWLWKGAWRAGKVGFIASRLWADNWRFRAYKRFEIERSGRLPVLGPSGPGKPDSRVSQFD